MGESRQPRNNPAPAKSGGKSPFKFGMDARKTGDEERQKQSERYGMAQRFWLRKNESCEIIVLDKEPSFGFNEHHMYNEANGRWDIFEVCVDTLDICPLCDIKKPSFTMFLTVIDKREYTNKKGKKIKFSKKLLPIKGNIQSLFCKMSDEFKGLRGLKVVMSRDSSDTSPRTGFPMPIKKLSEETLAKFYTVEEVKRDGKTIVAKDFFLKVFDYAKLFPVRTGKQLRDMYGGSHPAGSKEYNESVEEGIDDEVDDEQVPF